MSTMRARSTAAGGVVVGLLVAGALALTQGGGPIAANAADAPTLPKTITVMGEGKITVKPDMATISMGAQARGASASAALRTVNDKITQQIAALGKTGVKKEDITTSGLSVYTDTDRNGKVTGFVASSSLTVKVRDISKAGSTIDAAAAAAGDNVTLDGISFSVSDPEAKLGEARKAAIANAKKRADEYAAAVGGQTGEVLQVSETGAVMPIPMEQSYAMDSATAAKAFSVESGTQDLSVNVTVVYTLG